MNYERVVPRDFFNEALLLKCWGRLTLLLQDGLLGLQDARFRACSRRSLEDELDAKCEGFLVCQDPASGDIYLDNWGLWYGSDGEWARVHLSVPMAQTATVGDPYPMIFEADLPPVLGDVSVHGQVFDRDGSLHSDFRMAFGLPEQQSTPPRYRAAILWGETAAALERYEFDTQGELDAFFDGTAAVEGWDDWTLARDADDDDVSRLESTVGEGYSEIEAAIEWERQGLQRKE